MTGSGSVSAAIDNLRSIRAKRREEAQAQIDLLERLRADLDLSMTEINLTDPVTSRPLVLLDWSQNERGVSLSLQALDCQYVVGLEVHYEHGGVLASGVNIPSSDDAAAFLNEVFFGRPLRLCMLNDTVGMVSRVNGQERPFKADQILRRFVDAVAMAQHGSFERMD